MKSHKKNFSETLRGMFRLGAGLLPRSVLDAMETSEAFVPYVQQGQFDQLLEEYRELRIAFVRQDVFTDLYCCDHQLPAEEIVRQSTCRTGPAGLLVDLGADYWIVKEDPAAECSAWAEKIAGDKDPDPEKYREQKKSIPHDGKWGHSHPFSYYAASVDEVPWNNYDIVISLDISVPYRIIEKARRPLWVYMPGDPGVPTAKRSLKRPPGNYDISLTHGFRRHPVRPSLGDRAIEFPYTFLRKKTWEKVFSCPELEKKRGIIMENHTWDLLSSAEKAEYETTGPLSRPKGSLPEVAQTLNRSRYYLRCGGRPIVGNGLVEAIAAGCVAIGRRSEFINRSLLCATALIDDLQQGIEKIREFELSSERLDRIRGIQGNLLDYYCFYRPAHELLEIWHRIKGPRHFKYTAIHQKITG